MSKLSVGELFAGIGGIGLGLEMTGGFEVSWQVENNEYATKVLNKHWADTPKHDDVRTFPPEKGEWDVDVVTAGFPCQDISIAGHKKGLKGERSGLFYEVIRIANEIRPKWLLLENVARLKSKGLDEVLRCLAQIGYDAEWHCFPAACLGAFHRRDRIFILANPNSNANHAHRSKKEKKNRLSKVNRKKGLSGLPTGAGGNTEVLSDSDLEGLQGLWRLEEGIQRRTQETLRMCGRKARQSQWGSEPKLDRMVNGVPKRVDRTKCLGNAVVPQAAQFMGELLLQRENHG